MKEPIIGNRVILRELQEDDARFFADWYNEPEVMLECGFNKHTTLEAEVKRIRKPEDSNEDWYVKAALHCDGINFKSQNTIP